MQRISNKQKNTVNLYDSSVPPSDFAGLPKEVIRRAALMQEVIGNNQPVDRLCNENISAQDQLYKVLDSAQSVSTIAQITPLLFHTLLYICLQIQKAVDKMLAFDSLNGDLQAFFKDIFPS